MQKEELESKCERKLGCSMQELFYLIERFQAYATHHEDDKRVMDLKSFKDMLGMLGNFFISDRMFSAIDINHDGMISLEEFLVYNDIISHGTEEEKTLITFRMIDTSGDELVSFDEFKRFWTHFIQLYGEAL